MRSLFCAARARKRPLPKTCGYMAGYDWRALVSAAIRLPEGEEVRAALIRDGQQWETQKRACYKCENFKSNMPLTGRCGARENSKVIVSADMAKGDTCRNLFKLRADAKRKDV